jgi:hypothetical protein
MDASTVAHLIGCIGELLNLIGGTVFGLDLLTKKRERAMHDNLTAANRWAVQYSLHSITYKGKKVAAAGFITSILERRSAIRGYVGLVILLLGFVLLGFYHLIEIIYQKPP